MPSSTAKQLAEKACSFLSASTDPFHAVKQSIHKLEAAGFSRLAGGAALSGNIQPGGKYYYTVQNSTLVAFAVGAQYSEGGSGFKIIGGHTDSPNLRVKPRSKKPTKSGVLQLGVECYGLVLIRSHYLLVVRLFAPSSHRPSFAHSHHHARSL